MPRHPANISKPEYQRLAKHLLLPKQAKDHKLVEQTALEMEAEQIAKRAASIRKRLHELNGTRPMLATAGNSTVVVQAPRRRRVRSVPFSRPKSPKSRKG